jgi:YD repeat-containing protein
MDMAADLRPLISAFLPERRRSGDDWLHEVKYDGHGLRLSVTATACAYLLSSAIHNR